MIKDVYLNRIITGKRIPVTCSLLPSDVGTFAVRQPVSEFLEDVFDALPHPAVGTVGDTESTSEEIVLKLSDLRDVRKFSMRANGLSHTLNVVDGSLIVIETKDEGPKPNKDLTYDFTWPELIKHLHSIHPTELSMMLSEEGIRALSITNESQSNSAYIKTGSFTDMQKISASLSVEETKSLEFIIDNTSSVIVRKDEDGHTAEVFRCFRENDD